VVPDHWRRYLAPAAFLLAATIAVILIRSGVEAGSSQRSATTVGSPAPRKHVVATTSVTTTTKARTATRYWTVAAGDTFGVISAKSGVPVATIEQLNPHVHTTSLFIGERIRLK
jgi:LysM repeat protein